MLKKVFSKPIFRLSVVILVNENILCARPLLSKEIRHRSFARWSARKPSKVLSSEDTSLNSINSEDFYKSEYAEKLSFENESPKNDKKKEKDTSFLEKKVHSYANQDYVVVGEHDYTYSKLMSYVGNRNMRRKHDLIMLEGKRLNLDALQAGLKPKKIFFSQNSLLDELDLPLGSKIPLYKLPYKTIRLWSKLETPPGIVGFYSIPKVDDIVSEDTLPVKVICDNVRDPGNMGSVIRVAASVGCTEVILMKGCTDPWDSKVLRAASGGHFHIPIKMDLTWREHKKFLQPSDLVFLADSNLERKPLPNIDLPRHLYYDVNYATSSSVVIVVGGETEGLSHDAFTFASYYKGSRVYIPLSNCVESLNSGCALSVILFEIKRQILVNGINTSLNVTGRLLTTEEEVNSQNELDSLKDKSKSASSG